MASHRSCFWSSRACGEKHSNSCSRVIATSTLKQLPQVSAGGLPDAGPASKSWPDHIASSGLGALELQQVAQAHIPRPCASLMRAETCSDACSLDLRA